MRRIREIGMVGDDEQPKEVMTSTVHPAESVAAVDSSKAMVQKTRRSQVEVLADGNLKLIEVLAEKRASRQLHVSTTNDNEEELTPAAKLLEAERLGLCEKEKTSWKSNKAFVHVFKSEICPFSNIVESLFVCHRKIDITQQAKIVPWRQRDNEKDNRCGNAS